MKGRYLKKTFTYASRPDIVAEAKKKASESGTTLSEVIDKFVTQYVSKKNKHKKSFIFFSTTE
jgi:hypothetical protein